LRIDVVRQDDSITHLALVGRLDIAGVQQIDQEFHARTAARHKPALVDLSQVDFLSSLGMGLIVSCTRALGRHRAWLVLLCPSPQVEEALRTCGMDRITPITHNLEDALRLLSLAQGATACSAA
jgi:anti-anti-sigma factor